MLNKSYSINVSRITILHIYSVPLSSILGTKALRPPLHSLEINAIEKFDFAGQTFLMTGSEDTTLKIFGVNDNFRCVTQIATLTTHISSVKCIEVVEDKQFILAVSAGGRAQVHFSRISRRNTVIDRVLFWSKPVFNWIIFVDLNQGYNCRYKLWAPDLIPDSN